MGMFDSIRVEMPLPDGWVPPEGTLFQSKSLDSFMDTYLIDKDGQLFKTESYWDNEESKVLATETYPIPFHGEIRFYQHERQTLKERKEYKYKWHEYSAIFVRGKLIDLSTIRQPEEDNGGSNESNTGGSDLPPTTGA
jgi:hypothetical protein